MAAVDTISDPVAEAVVVWRTAEEGGRRSGPPTVPVYLASSVFVLGNDSEVQPGWPWTADPMLSIWIERIALDDDGSWLCKVDYPVREIATPYVIPGTKFLIMEGPTVVATGRFTKIYSG